ncbi:hypothetical protein DSM02_2500 [Leeuwenhoekiella polynyae]|uniref:J domain-containing protein n=2 Tax=Leeuwenhoekiella polynyae TaxID=1550906 RepID=A0A4Q0P463_9FLAO|nr:hypothetical protein DSM02_2500 [Leeuwenhoekiella polynyae]
MTNLELTIIEKIKKELNISDEVSIIELHDKLYKERNLTHPDKVDEKLKEKAKERFSILNNLLKELKIYIDRHNLKSSSSLILFENDYEKINDRSKILRLEKDILDLKKVIKKQEKENKKLKSTLKKIQKDKSQELTDKLKNYYEPKRSSFLVLGISAFLLILINISVQIQRLSAIFLDFLPIKLDYFNLVLIIILGFIFLSLLYKNFKYRKIQNITEELKSPSFITTFCHIYAKEHEDYFETKFFLESSIERSITNRHANKKFKNQSWHKKDRIIKRIIEVLEDRIKNPIGINDQKSLNYLKDIFIYNLITKGYIRFGKSNNLDREFLIE